MARAYALAEAAAEELGKLVLLNRVGAEVAMGGGKVDWAGFCDKFHDHGPKAWNVAFLDHLVSEQPADRAAGNVDAVYANADGIAKAQREAAHMVELRERAMYVDFRDGKVRRPADAEMIVKAVSDLTTLVANLGLVVDEDRLKLIGGDPGLRRRAYELRKRLNRLNSGRTQT